MGTEKRPLEGRVSLVTGASRGIGRSIALGLAGQGSDVALAARDTASLAVVAAECETRGVRARPFAIDVGEGGSVEKGVGAVLETFGRLDHLVNNAGTTGDGLLLRMKRQEWDRVIGVNLTGAFEVTRAALPTMVRARYGRIVSITSVVGLMGNPGQANYCAAKAGLVGFTKALAREVASRQITVNAVAPGLIDTEMTRAMPAESRDRMAGVIPLGRPGTPEDVAAVVVFLVSPQAGYITGEVINVSGGLYM